VLRFFRRGPRATGRQDPLEPIAAAVGVGLYLQGARAVVPGDVAAAIATALFLRGSGRAGAGAIAPEEPFSAWKLAGRTQQMMSRVHRQERPSSHRT